MPSPTAGPGHQVRKGGKQLFVFDTNVLESPAHERKIWGLATGPQLDRENETILKAAIEAALPNFMHLPIMHLDHTERPVGWFTKAEFKGQDPYVEGLIKPSSDCDKFWEDVVKASRNGKPYQFSIYGDRTQCTESCMLLPDDPRRVADPCITKALELYSISICQPGTAINPNTFAEVIKAMGMSKKATDSAASIIHPTTDGKYPREERKTMDDKKDETMEKQVTPPASGEETPQEPQPGEEGGDKFDKIVTLLETVVERLQALEAGIGVNKAETNEAETPEEEKKEAEKCGCKKAAPVTPETPAPAATPEIAKADLGRITKAEELLNKLDARVLAIEKATKKGPDVLVVDPNAVKKAEEAMQKDTQAQASSLTHLTKIYH